MIHLSNNLKTLLLLDDITKISTTSNSVISSSDCITVQDFNYRYFRHVDEASLQCGPTQCTVLYLTIKSPSYSKIKTFYDQFTSQEDYFYSFLFSPSFPSSLKLEPSTPIYDGGIVIQGYIINISEEFESTSEDEMLMKIDIVLQSITYIGASETKTKKTLILNKI